MRVLLGLLSLVLGLTALPASAQRLATRWLTAGELHSGYTENGSEPESVIGAGQQSGLRWPGLNPFGDTQVSRGLWIGATNVADGSGTTYPVRVVHVGPRVRGVGEVFPTAFELVSRYPRPTVMVDGLQSSPAYLRSPVDRVDPDQTADAMIRNEIHTLLGISMERRVLQFSQEHHDDYHITEYTFVNTGNADADADIELPNQTLTGVVFFLMDRIAVTGASRYLIGNPTGWGANTMIDVRGDGVLPDPAGEQVRAHIAWHGKYPAFTAYDNLGASLQEVAGWPVVNVAETDSVGRLAASAFVGVGTIHADASASDANDDPAQPFTTTYFDSDAVFTAQNDATSVPKMQVEYELMTSGHKTPRHAYAVEPSGLPGFLNPSADPRLSTPAGYSFASGYGPYTMAPGDTVRILTVRAVSGLSRDASLEIGRAFKASGNDAAAGLSYQGETKTKNEWVFTSRDSLFQTLHRAIGNAASGYAIPRAPHPPASFTVTSGPFTGGPVELAWTPPEDPTGLAGYEIYRATGAYDSTYTRIHVASPSESQFVDDTAPLSQDLFYYIVSVGRAEDNDGTADTPAGALRSSRYATQTYTASRYYTVDAEGRADNRRLRLLPLSPNPARERVHVRFDLASPMAVSATVYSVTGSEIARLAEGRLFHAGRTELAWPLGEVAPGVYLLRVSAGDQEETSRIVVMR
ncbi:MAG: hypothetical protein Rubg2KO_36220 [Rubricoccaceae bacterium]